MDSFNVGFGAGRCDSAGDTTSNTAVSVTPRAARAHQ
jgi:hypothetical protein